MGKYSRSEEMLNLFDTWNKQGIYILSITSDSINIKTIHETIVIFYNVESVISFLNSELVESTDYLEYWINKNSEPFSLGKEQYIPTIIKDEGILNFHTTLVCDFLGAKYLSKEKKEEAESIFGNLKFKQHDLNNNPI